MVTLNGYAMVLSSLLSQGAVEIVPVASLIRLKFLSNGETVLDLQESFGTLDKEMIPLKFPQNMENT